MPIIKREKEKRQQQLEKLIRESSTSTRVGKRCGRIVQQPIHRTNFLRQGEGANRRGSQKHDISKERTDRVSENEKA
jgi:hypothetical protein